MSNNTNKVTGYYHKCQRCGSVNICFVEQTMILHKRINEIDCNGIIRFDNSNVVVTAEDLNIDCYKCKDCDWTDFGGFTWRKSDNKDIKQEKLRMRGSIDIEKKE